jgi:hypothetical protein
VCPHLCAVLQKLQYTLSERINAYECTSVIKKYGECCCQMRSNGKAGIFNTGSGASNLNNNV